ncbi:MAG: outer membrane lipoprotein carrier protein LolA [Ahrensia sp.]|nr:outer membrane lipoprotein carrier protein LolA [Ahrensia sp.]
MTVKFAVTKTLLAGVLATLVLAAPAQSAVSGSDKETIEAISQHFAGVPSMMGEFVQFGPNGEQSGGKFFLQRPGRIRFDYAKPSPIQVKADGRTVGIHNKKLDTWDFFPLSKTPLRLLLAERINVNDEAIKSVKREADLTTVVLSDRSIFGSSKITLMFDPESFELRQWTITDDQGKDTSVMIFNVQTNVKLSQKLFRLNQRSANRNIDPTR